MGIVFVFYDWMNGYLDCLLWLLILDIIFEYNKVL